MNLPLRIELPPFVGAANWIFPNHSFFSIYKKAAVSSETAVLLLIDIFQ